MGKVLIIEDDPAVAKLFERLLEAMGHGHLLAATSVEAIALLEKERPDLILLDIMLAGATTGLRVLVHCHHMLQTRKMAEIPVIVISAVPERELAGIAHAYPFVKRYFTKPFVVEELTAEISSHLPDSAERREPS